MNVASIPAGGYASNCWLFWDEDAREAAVVDPSADVKSILAALQQRRLALKWILLTHGHFDHIFSLDALRDRTGAPAAIHAADAGTLTDPQGNASAYFLRENHIYRPAEKILSDGDRLTLGSEEIRVISAPGHTPGSAVYECGNIWFTGDVLFDGSIGRTDLPGGDMSAMRCSLARLIRGEERILYPGHGGQTTLSLQKESNPYLYDI